MSATSVGTGGKFCVQIEELNAAMRTTRLCGGDFGTNHLQSFESASHGPKCHWCGKKAYTKCSICGVPLHNFSIRGADKGKACSVHWHDQKLFGLGHKDSTTLKSKDGMKWRTPSDEVQVANKEHIDNLIQQGGAEGDDDSISL